MIYRFRVILDSKEDVFRDLEVEGENSLEDLHRAIKRSFGIQPGEMGSFYLSDEDWSQGLEIPMLDMGMSKEPIKTMSEFNLIEIFTNHKYMLYVYDFLNMWTFFVEFTGVVDKDAAIKYPIVTFKIGENPKEPPAKEFDPLDAPKDIFGDAFGDSEEDDEFGEF